jgi:TPR repeat protein
MTERPAMMRSIGVILAAALAALGGASLAADQAPRQPVSKTPKQPGVDYAREVPRLEAQVQHGDVNAMELLGELYAAGLGVKRNPQHACDLFEHAATKDLAEAQHNFADCWRYGLGRPRDHAKSADWYGRAVKQGFLPSYCALADQYRNGLGVPQDKAKAFELCTKGAENGDPDALGALGEMYLGGEGTKRDPVKAADALRRAAEQGQANAARLLGLIYFNGDGVARDPNLARDWLMRAADGGRRDAFLPLGKLFLAASGDLASGKLVDANAVPALFWLKLASEYEPVPARRAEAQKLYDRLAAAGPSLVKQMEPDLKPWRDAMGKP